MKACLEPRRKAAIYARFSSTLQDARSVDDQVRICRERAEREGWEVADVFADYAISGAVRERPGLNALLARAGEFGVVVAEAIDRISRHQADIATIYETLKFNGCQLVTLSEGPVSEIHIGFSGTMAALFRTNLADKIRRGQSGRVAAGRIPGNICYGYRKVIRHRPDGEPERGLREINPDQAAIVLRVFEEAAVDRSAHQIVTRLNADGIPSPTGRLWNVSMVNGDAVRGNGVLRNQIYIGRLLYGRTRMVRDPVTRRRVPRVQPREQWQVREVPELRIVPQELWDRVHARLEAREGWAYQRQRRPKLLLSGLVQCGLCGGNYIQVGTAERLWGCSTHRSKGACGNGRKIGNVVLERRVLDGLKHQLLDPEVVRLAIRKVHKYVAEAEKAQNAARIRLERKHAEATAKVERLVSAFANGGREFDEIRDILTAAKAERAAIEAELKEIDASKVIPILPSVAGEYKRAVDRLSASLSTPEAALDAVPALRSLIESIRVWPRQGQSGLDIELTGRLAGMVAMATGKPCITEPLRLVANGPMMKGVAEDRYALHHRITRIVV